MTIRVEFDGLDELIDDMGKASRRLDREIGKVHVDLAELVAGRARRNATGGDPQLRAITSSIQARRDRIVAGGGRRATSSGATASEIFFGANFGSNHLAQFPAESDGRTIYPALRASQSEIDENHLDAAQRVWMQ